MAGPQTWIVGVIVKAILNWVAEMILKLVNHYKKKAKDKAENEAIRKEVENAQTDQELQDALNRAGNNLPKP